MSLSPSLSCLLLLHLFPRAQRLNWHLRRNTQSRNYVWDRHPRSRFAMIVQMPCRLTNPFCFYFPILLSHFSYLFLLLVYASSFFYTTFKRRCNRTRSSTAIVELVRSSFVLLSLVISDSQRHNNLSTRLIVSPSMRIYFFSRLRHVLNVGRL